MKFHVLTLFPEMITRGLESGILGRAAKKNCFSLNAVNIRDYTLNKHGKVDDYPYGGGAGMLMQAQPVYDAWRAAAGDRRVRTVYVTPQGRPFCQSLARELAEEEELIFLCGHYEGVDERVLEEIVTDYISIGDYVLTGGELPAMVIVDAVARLLPGVLGNETSAEEESFHNDLLEYPQYSRPEVWRGRRVPGELLSGDHKRVALWRLEEALRRTRHRRPDLYEKYQEKRCLIARLSKNKRENIHMIESLSRGFGEILYWQGDDILICHRESRVCMARASGDEAARRLAAMIPEETELVVSSQESLNGAFEKRGYSVDCETWQYLYTEKVKLPVKHRDIRRLGTEYLDHISERQEHNDRAYIEGCLRRGDMYGVFIGDRLAGFAGMHREGSMGLLYVEETFRGQGAARSLEAFLVNRNLEKGWTPYAHVACGDEASQKLQEKLGFYRSAGTVWWLKKKLAFPG